MQRRTLKKGDWFYISFYIADLEWLARYSVRRALLKILKPASLGLSKMDSAQSVNNGYKKYPLFFEYIKKDTALKYPSKAVHIIHMMGEEIFYVRIFICFYFLCKKNFNFF